jgi:hypothetical protein
VIEPIAMVLVVCILGIPSAALGGFRSLVFDLLVYGALLAAWRLAPNPDWAPACFGCAVGTAYNIQHRYRRGKYARATEPTS